MALIIIAVTLPIAQVSGLTILVKKGIAYFLDVNNLRKYLRSDVSTLNYLGYRTFNSKRISNDYDEIKYMNHLREWWDEFSDFTVAFTILSIIIKCINVQHVFILQLNLSEVYTLSAKNLEILINILYIIFLDSFILFKFGIYQIHNFNEHVFTRIMNMFTVAIILIGISVIVILLQILN